MASKKGRVTGIFYYPVKSVRGIAASSVEIGDRGIKNDRNWVVSSMDGKAFTQRDISQMVFLEATMDSGGTLTLGAPDRAPYTVVRGNDSRNCTVDVWGNQCAGVDEGDEVASWLGSFLGTDCRLVRVADDNDRECASRLPDGNPVKLAFADGWTFLVVSQESLDDLNGRLAEPITMNRFRPSIVVSGLGAYSEDNCRELKIGELSFFNSQPCARCVITTIDPESGVRGAEPLKTLSSYRLVDSHVNFGAYYLHSQSGRISIGDEVVATS